MRYKMSGYDELDARPMNKANISEIPMHRVLSDMDHQLQQLNKTIAVLSERLSHLTSEQSQGLVKESKPSFGSSETVRRMVTQVAQVESARDQLQTLMESLEV